MSLWLWTFWTYSFLGYLLERGYAIATHADRQARKCFLLLPMCPVYGLGALAVLALPESLSGSFWSLALWGGLAATAVEYAVHVLYDRLLGVRFWDYSQVRWNLRGRVCLPFSLAWSLLVAAGLPVIQAAIAPALAAVPPTATYAALLVFTADTVVSLQLRSARRTPLPLSPTGSSCPERKRTGVFRFIRFRFSCFSMQAIPRSISRKSPMVGSPPQRGSARYWSTFSVLAESQSYPVRLGANF